MSMRRAVLAALVALTGCFTAPVPTPARPVVTWPDVPRAKRLAVGQWALYRERDGDDVGYAQFAAMSEGSCGTWVRVVLFGRGEGRLWMLCVRAGGAIETAILDGSTVVDPEHPGTHAADLTGFASRLAPPALDATAAADNVRVSAGTFEGALRTAGPASTTWIHPAVPFGGVVRITAGPARTDELVAYGDHLPLPQPRPHSPWFFEGGVGIGWLSGTQSYESSQTTVLSYDAGMRIAPAWDLVFGLTGGTAESGDYRTTNLVVGGGVRIRPLQNDLYVRAIAGFARLWSEQWRNVNSFGIAAAVGYPIVRAHDWRLSAELGDDVSYFGGDVGVRDALHAAAVLEVRAP
jgi:hypothetical protein